MWEIRQKRAFSYRNLTELLKYTEMETQEIVEVIQEGEPLSEILELNEKVSL